ncbi:unnamed protein product [Cladocopium goreaui]|uniref:Coenzyme gamma-F420-2:alpha-L-glutamate ligase n=1 Tax=Cladocopium goreaui TaxID=2562237 RepID=A0A9P1FR66_9DINO|nr:unnamed protein product [Cladocopium goreaui]
MVPPMGWIEPHPESCNELHSELFREMFLQTFPTVGVSRPHLIEEASETKSGVRYLWRVGGAHEFELPLQEGELYEKRLPYQIAEWYSQFSKQGGILYPPPETYVYYQNKVGLANLFNERKVKIPATWVFSSFAEAEAEQDNIQFPVVIKDPYGYSSLGLMQAADKEEFLKNVKLHFEHALPGVETIVQSKVVALREARVTYIEGRPFHAYWRIRKSLDSASAASNLGGYQDFDFPMQDIAPYVAEFANQTGIPVGGVDFIWEAADADVKTTPYTLEVSPTSDINPQGPRLPRLIHWKSIEFEASTTLLAQDLQGVQEDERPDEKLVRLCRNAQKEMQRLLDYKGFHAAWGLVTCNKVNETDLMTLAVIDKYRRERKDLFVDIDNVVALSMERVRRCKGNKKAYTAAEVMQDKPVPGAAEALRRLREHYFIRFLTARGSYEDPFNVTQTWLDLKGFEYDELIVVDGPESKVAHLSADSILVDDFTLGHEKEEPSINQKFIDQLTSVGHLGIRTWKAWKFDARS